MRTLSCGVEVDPGGGAPGRGGYCCRSGSCLDRALRRGSLARALRTGISSEDVVRLYGEAVEYL